jgi:hypothetical protein
MQAPGLLLDLPGRHFLTLAGWLLVFAAGARANAAPAVEFDFARLAEGRDVTPSACSQQYPSKRVIELTLPVSVRFRGVAMDDVEELDIEINGAASGLTVYDFSPSTQLASDVAREIETTTTTKKARSLDATLGGQLPVPYAEVIAHVSPSINAGTSRNEMETEKFSRLPPKHAVVVSGTSSEGRGVFFKLRRSSQTSLEGLHELNVAFVAPADWRRGDIRVTCAARGRRKVLWLEQKATLGSATGDVRLYLSGMASMHEVAKPALVERRPTLLEVAAAELADMVEVAKPDKRAKANPAD